MESVSKINTDVFPGYSGNSYKFSVPDPSGNTSEDILNLRRITSFEPDGSPFRNAMNQMYPVSSGFENHQSMKNYPDLTKFNIDRHPVYDSITNEVIGHVVASARQKWFYPQIEGFDDKQFLNPVEDYHNPFDREADRLGRWKETTEQSNAIDIVKPNPEIGLWQGPEHKIKYSKFHPDMTDVELYVTDLNGIVPINLVGPYISRIQNEKQTLSEILADDETKELFDNFYSKEGGGSDIIGIGVLNRKNAAAATYKQGNEAIFFGVKDGYEKALGVALQYGLISEGDVRNGNTSRLDRAVMVVKTMAHWYHEFKHAHTNKNLSYKQEEMEIASDLAEFCEERASVLDVEKAQNYKAMQRFHEDYKRDWEEGKFKEPHRVVERPLKQIIEYMLEAKEMGYNRKEAKRYAENKLAVDENEITSELEERVRYETEKSEDSGSEDKIENSVAETSDVAYEVEAETYSEDSESNDSSDNADAEDSGSEGNPSE